MRSMAGIGLVLTLASTAALAEQRSGLGLSFASNQAGVPLQILRVTSSGSVLFEQVAVRNVSNQQISGVKFGVALAPAAAGVPPRVLPGELLSTRIEAGNEAVLDARVLGRSTAVAALAELGATSGHADLGLLEVVFTDGTAWSYLPDPLLGFRSAPTVDLAGSGHDCAASPQHTRQPTSALGYFFLLHRHQRLPGVHESWE